MKALTLPEEKLNQLAQDTSEKLFANHYFDQGLIKGEQLKTFCDYNQINKFLLFQVYQVWNMQLGKLKHPYFDFENEEIQKSLQVLRNQLSQYIRISKEDFKPMLKRAVYNNIKLLLNPKETFSSFFFANRDQTSLELYERYTPFFSDMDFVVNSILKYHRKHEMDTVEKEIFFVKMEKVLELFDSKSETSFQDYRVNKIQELTGSNIMQVIAEAEEEEAKRLAEYEAEKMRLEEEARKKEEAERIAEQEKQQREEEERKRQMELAEEEAKKKQSFFDTIETAGSFFEIEEDSFSSSEVSGDGLAHQTLVPSPSSESNSIELPVEEPVSEPVINKVPEVETPAPVEEISEAVSEIVEEVEEKKEEIEDKIEEEVTPAVKTVEEVVQTPVVESKTVFENLTPPVEASAPEEPVILPPSQEVPPVIMDNQAEVPKMAESFVEENSKIETIADKLSKKIEQPSIIEDFQQNAGELNKSETRRPTIADKLAEQQKEKQATESTESFLDRFINNKKAERQGIGQDKPAPKPVEPQAPVEPPVAKEETPVEQVSQPVTPPARPIIEQTESKAPAIDIPLVAKNDSNGSSEQPKSLIDSFQKEPKANVHDKLGVNGKIKLNEIPIHKQYQFVQKVFDGNNVRFRIIVDKVNNSETRDEVNDIIKRFVLNNDKVDQNDQVTKEFVSMLQSRFMEGSQEA